MTKQSSWTSVALAQWTLQHLNEVGSPIPSASEERGWHTDVQGYNLAAGKALSGAVRNETFLVTTALPQQLGKGCRCTVNTATKEPLCPNTKSPVPWNI
jgi:hypothetical protein